MINNLSTASFKVVLLLLKILKFSTETISKIASSYFLYGEGGAGFSFGFSTTLSVDFSALAVSFFLDSAFFFSSFSAFTAFTSSKDFSYSSIFEIIETVFSIGEETILKNSLSNSSGTPVITIGFNVSIVLELDFGKIETDNVFCLLTILISKLSTPKVDICWKKFIFLIFKD